MSFTPRAMGQPPSSLYPGLEPPGDLGSGPGIHWFGPGGSGAFPPSHGFLPGQQEHAPIHPALEHINRLIGGGHGLPTDPISALIRALLQSKGVAGPGRRANLAAHDNYDGPAFFSPTPHPAPGPVSPRNQPY